jgi:SAM-dependent methyltransferase
MVVAPAVDGGHWWSPPTSDTDGGHWWSHRQLDAEDDGLRRLTPSWRRRCQTAAMSGFDGARYQARFDDLARQGVDVHGEATFVRSFGPRSVLDAGCGTGRVAIELARHGIEVVGVDGERSMIDQARRRAPELDWVEADLAGLELGRRFDLVVMAGNVLLFTAPGTEPAVVAACAAHVDDGGVLVAGFQLGRGISLADYDTHCSAAGLRLEQRWATWDRQPFDDDSDYAVSVHRRERPSQI